MINVIEINLMEKYSYKEQKINEMAKPLPNARVLEI